MSLSPSRRAAFQVLQRVAASNVAPATLLHGRLGRELGEADRSLMNELVYGVLRWQALVDHVAEAHAKRPARGIDPPFLIALRLGLYQLRFLDRIPARAALDESVELAKVFGSVRGSRFVNAVLRSVTRHPNVPVLPTRDKNPLAYLAITLSHPEWLARRYLDRLGLENAEARCKYNNRPPPTDVRVESPGEMHTILEELDREGIVAHPHPLVPLCLRIVSGRVADSRWVRDGRMVIQEAGSQLLPFLLGIRAGAPVLDACAAPGGKTTQLARWSQPACVLAMDRRLQRVRLVKELANRIGCTNVALLVADGTRPPFPPAAFPRILLDAPCSGLGTLARNPDIKWRVRETDLSRFAELERRLLEACASLLATGGRLLYSTCSTEPEENQDVVRDFLNRHPDFIQVAADARTPGRSLMGEDGSLETRPERDDLDGYYAVLLERRLPSTP